MKECMPILKSINDPFFYVKMNDYLRFIDDAEDPQSKYSQRMRIL